MKCATFSMVSDSGAMTGATKRGKPLYTHTAMDSDNNCSDESVFSSHFFFCVDVNLVDTNEKVLLRNEVHKNSLVQNSHVHSIVPFKHFIFFLLLVLVPVPPNASTNQSE